MIIVSEFFFDLIILIVVVNDVFVSNLMFSYVRYKQIQFVNQLYYAKDKILNRGRHRMATDETDEVD